MIKGPHSPILVKFWLHDPVANQSRYITTSTVLMTLKVVRVITIPMTTNVSRVIT